MQRRVLGHQAKLEAEFRRSLQTMRTEYRKEAFDELSAESREALLQCAAAIPACAQFQRPIPARTSR